VIVQWPVTVRTRGWTVGSHRLNGPTTATLRAPGANVHENRNVTGRSGGSTSHLSTGLLEQSAAVSEWHAEYSGPEQSQDVPVAAGRGQRMSVRVRNRANLALTSWCRVRESNGGQSTDPRTCTPGCGRWIARRSCLWRNSGTNPSLAPGTAFVGSCVEAKCYAQAGKRVRFYFRFTTFPTPDINVRAKATSDPSRPIRSPRAGVLLVGAGRRSAGPGPRPVCVFKMRLGGR
jgi:hypothetical protein